MKLESIYIGNIDWCGGIGVECTHIHEQQQAEPRIEVCVKNVAMNTINTFSFHILFIVLASGIIVWKQKEITNYFHILLEFGPRYHSFLRMQNCLLKCEQNINKRRENVCVKRTELCDNERNLPISIMLSRWKVYKSLSSPCACTGASVRIGAYVRAYCYYDLFILKCVRVLQILCSCAQALAAFLIESRNSNTA